jgi:NIPSNAP
MLSRTRFISRTSLLNTSARLLATQSATPIVELREYQLQCGNSGRFLEVTAAAEKLRKSLVPLRLFSAPDTGGMLNMMTHFYYYEGGLEQRDAARVNAAKSAEWKEYLSLSRPNVLQQRSAIFVESPLLQKHGLAGMKKEFIGDGKEADVIYEIRRYKLKLGYDIVPQFMEMYGRGLPSKLSATGTDPSTSLCSLMYNEVGDLNTVIEVWRHGGGVRAMHTSRVAARTAIEWRSAINQIATLSVDFTTTIHKPLGFSNWK